MVGDSSEPARDFERKDTALAADEKRPSWNSKLCSQILQALKEADHPTTSEGIAFMVWLYESNPETTHDEVMAELEKVNQKRKSSGKPEIRISGRTKFSAKRFLDPNYEPSNGKAATTKRSPTLEDATQNWMEVALRELRQARAALQASEHSVEKARKTYEQAQKRVKQLVPLVENVDPALAKELRDEAQVG